MKLYDVIRKEQVSKPETAPTEKFTFTEARHKKKKSIVFFALFLTFVMGIYVLGLQFTRATVSVEQRTVAFNLEDVVLELPHETKSDPTRLSFQTMTVNSSINREIFGSELREVSGKARGSIVFFNEYSKNPTTLKAGTKVVSPSAKQYQTDQAVTIPGYKMDGKKKVPGTSSSVAVTAVEVGSQYNAEGTSLSIIGYTGTKKIQLYARSIGGFQGGDAGMRHTVSDEDREELIETLRTQLIERLNRETRAQIPDSLVTYSDLQFVSIDTKSIKLEGNGVKFPAYIEGSMVSYLIPRTILESSIAHEVLSDHSYTSVSIPQLNNLSVQAIEGVPADPSITPESIKIKVSGQGSIITTVSQNTIKDLLLGTRRNEFTTIVSAIPEISSAKFSLYPFWAPVFPKDPDNISVHFK